ncbi:MFS transporter [Bifidobacterium avesanii]|nr:MFS transporter [Bifidobacterium avesanii]KAB8294427.1 major facilitator superfamily protein [Bifidobacterium avesanii]
MSDASRQTQSPWKVRDYRVWFTADTSLLIGVSIGAFAFDLLGYTVSHDVAVAGFVATVYSLVRGAATLAGGVIIDRFDRKRLMVVGGLASFAVLVGMIGAWLAGLMTVPVLFAFAALRGLTSGLFSGVTDTVLPQIVSGGQLTQAYAANQTRDAVAGMLSSPLSGWLYAFGPEIPFIVSAVMYVVLVACAPFIRADLRPEAGRAGDRRTEEEKAEAAAHADKSLTAALRWFAQWPAATVNFALIAIMNFGLNLGPTIAILHQQAIGTPAWIIGMLNLFNGAGMLIGSTLTEPMTKRLRGGRVVQISLMPTVVALVVMTLTDNPWTIAVSCGVAVFLLIPGNAVIGAYTELIVPNDMRGRVNSFFSLLSMLLGSLASALSGVMLKAMGYTLAMAVSTLVLVAALALTIGAKAVRDIPFCGEFDAIQPLPLKA